MMNPGVIIGLAANDRKPKRLVPTRRRLPLFPVATGERMAVLPGRQVMNIKVRPRLYLCPGLAGTLMTPEEFDTVTDYQEGYRYELIYGVLVVTPLPLQAETDPNEELGRLLRNYQADHPQGRSLDVTLPQQYIATATSRRQADRVIWAGLGRMPEPLRDVPTIAVEFVSKRRRDRQRDYVAKRAEYLAAGMAEYWIFDRFRRILTVVTPGPNGPQDQVVAEGDRYESPRLPGFQVPLARILAVADAWAQRKK
jgi:Uma2 family endonuclease